jgi:branched-chain amino acid transport system ATP-binding protein
MAALFELDGVSKSYGALRATHNLTLSVDAGEALAVIGPNGAGKSTLFNLITGDLALDCGRIVFARADISELAPHARSRLLASGARTRFCARS